MKLSKDEVRKVAMLANLDLSVKEEDLYTKTLGQILEYVDKINSVSVTGVEPTFSVVKEGLEFREDETEVCLSQEEALSNARSTKDGFFMTKGVFGE